MLDGLKKFTLWKIIFLLLKQVEFPSVTICGPGSSDKTLEAGFYKLYLNFLAENNVTIEVTPYSTAQLLQVQAVLVIRGLFICEFAYSRT
jgi:hypothetical protein